MRYIRFFVFTLLAFCLTACSAQAQTPVQKHGDLRISGKHVIDKNGAVTSLAGPSFFWSNTGWGQDRFYTRGAVETFAKDWRAGIVRVAVGAQNDGSILKDRRGNLKRAQTVIEAAIDNGLYVIVDWHSHQAENDVKEAQAFFTHIAKRYGHNPNIIYEIYNEPLDTTDWKWVIKPYAEVMIKTIRQVDPDNLIIVGTQSWATEVDKAADDPIRGQKNILYALHFYAATHKEFVREKAEYAIKKGLPLIISEWGSVTYSGDGYIDIESSIEWMKFAKKHGLTHLNWAVSDKDETASMLKPGASSHGGWQEKDLTVSGRLAREIMRNW
ncbi:glycoside hydrolase family 5 protein [Hellea balneolensis]|uniref:glycoside hydrolase family 5 protein n=1 Tax=Hellea balneolensis TaxID=287478 RepID=UPI00041E2E2A|nr:glycoside hydrolase family 5 protein [Hellea balneolensis]